MKEIIEGKRYGKPTKYSLSSSRLSETTEHHWFVTAAQFRSALKGNGTIKTQCSCDFSKPASARLRFDANACSIGCAKFSRSVWKKIRQKLAPGKPTSASKKRGSK